MDHTELVPGTLGDAGRPPSNNDSLIEHIVSPYPPNNTSPSASQVKTSSGSHIWGNIESQNVSKTTQYILLSSWRKSTRGRYNSVLQQWHDFCGREETNYLLPDVTSVLKFFTELYEKGCQYSSITLARSALASVVTLRGYATLSDHPLIKRFIKGVFHLRPPKPKYSSIWDADILLRHLQQIAATKEYIKCEAEYKVAHKKFLLTTVCPYGPPHKDTIARWVKNTLAQAGKNTNIFHPIVADHLLAVRPIIWAWILIPY